jgi:hypothetical protein
MHRASIRILAALVAAGSVTPAAGARDVARHVPTAVYCCRGYANDTVPPREAAPYVTWANTDVPDSAAADRAAGIKNVIQYIDASRIYTSDPAYRVIEDGAKYAGARALNCSRELLRTTNPAGFVIDPFNPETVQVLNWSLDHWYGSAYTSYFFDDVDAFRWDLANGPPCTGNPPVPWSEPATSKAYAKLLASVRLTATGRAIVPKIVLNGLSAYFDKPPQHLMPLYALAPPNVIGGMCESCYAQNTPDALRGGLQWQDGVDIEIKTIQLRKIFWDYDKYIRNDPDARLYTFASFMLAWDPEYSIYQTAYKPQTPGQLHVTPETGIVAYDPIKTDIVTVYDLRDPGGTFFREYRKCYYRASPIGPCAFVVNSDTSPERPPKLSFTYRHTVEVSGGMVLEGGKLSTQGPEPPLIIPPMRGFIFTR